MPDRCGRAGNRWCRGNGFGSAGKGHKFRAGISRNRQHIGQPLGDLFRGAAFVPLDFPDQFDRAADLIRQFEGSTAELLATALRLWWERVGETRTSGILKLMMSEARNFPEIAQFYVDEVIRPSDSMLGQIVQRGIDRGEFRPVVVADVVHVLVTPLLFLVMNKHSLGACSVGSILDPKPVIEAQIDLMLHGLLRPGVANGATVEGQPDSGPRPRVKPGKSR